MSKMGDRDIPLCTACGKRCEVYGSSWCAACHSQLPEFVKDRLIRFRNALITVGAGGLSVKTMGERARQALGFANDSVPVTPPGPSP